MLTITELRNAEYAISSVALDEHYAGTGEAPGAWTGRFAPALGLSGVVDAEDLRAVVEGHHPAGGTNPLAGRRRRRVNLFDATSRPPSPCPCCGDSVGPRQTGVVSRAHTEAVTVALSFLEDHAAVARQQTKGVRRRVGTAGFAVAGSSTAPRCGARAIPARPPPPGGRPGGRDHQAGAECAVAPSLVTNRRQRDQAEREAPGRAAGRAGRRPARLSAPITAGSTRRPRRWLPGRPWPRR